MAEITRLEYFAGLAVQAMVQGLTQKGSNALDAQIAKRAFEVAHAMEEEAVKHNLDDHLEARAAADAAELAHELRAGHDAEAARR